MKSGCNLLFFSRMESLKLPQQKALELGIPPSQNHIKAHLIYDAPPNIRLFREFDKIWGCVENEPLTCNANQLSLTEPISVFVLQNENGFSEAQKITPNTTALSLLQPAFGDYQFLLLIKFPLDLIRLLVLPRMAFFQTILSSFSINLSNCRKKFAPIFPHKSQQTFFATINHARKA